MLINCEKWYQLEFYKCSEYCTALDHYGIPVGIHKDVGIDEGLPSMEVQPMQQCTHGCNIVFHRRAAIARHENLFNL